MIELQPRPAATGCRHIDTQHTRTRTHNTRTHTHAHVNTNTQLTHTHHHHHSRPMSIVRSTALHSGAGAVVRDLIMSPCTSTRLCQRTRSVSECVCVLLLLIQFGRAFKLSATPADRTVTAKNQTQIQHIHMRMYSGPSTQRGVRPRTTTPIAGPLLQ